VIARSREPAPRIATALGLLALILTVAEVQTVDAAIVPGCFGNRGLSCRGTKSSNPSPSSAESATNLVAAGGVARGWDSEFESALLQRRVCKPSGAHHAFDVAQLSPVPAFSVPGSNTTRPRPEMRNRKRSTSPGLGRGKDLSRARYAS